MPAFYTRHQADERLVVRISPLHRYATLAVVGLLLLASMGSETGALSDTPWVIPFVAAYGVFQFYWFLKTRHVMTELRRATREGSVATSGSVWSFGNPVTYTYPVPRPQ